MRGKNQPPRVRRDQELFKIPALSKASIPDAIRENSPGRGLIHDLWIQVSLVGEVSNLEEGSSFDLADEGLGGTPSEGEVT